jgi:hypothetical protein
MSLTPSSSRSIGTLRLERDPHEPCSEADQLLTLLLVAGLVGPPQALKGKLAEFSR